MVGSTREGPVSSVRFDSVSSVCQSRFFRRLDPRRAIGSDRLNDLATLGAVRVPQQSEARLLLDALRSHYFDRGVTGSLSIGNAARERAAVSGTRERREGCFRPLKWNINRMFCRFVI